jgi:asparagine synthase (glutamine-hydrolysing)
MCGIAGVIGRDRDRVRDATSRMTAALAHRGPDADGVEVLPFGSSWVGLGHRRLAIQDLSPLGRNPMRHVPSGCWITYNGEVYNFPKLRADLERDGEQFKSGSDTEVVLAGITRHGPSFIKRLEGMYAFALFDPRGPNPSVTIVRDPAGIKPLYVAQQGGFFLFASEVRAILAAGFVPRRISKAAVGGMLAFGSIPQPLTIFDAIRMNPPGSWQSIHATEASWTADTPTVWWKPPSPETPSGDVVSETRRHLDQAVRDHLISDVPVGVFLSAGLDSSVIAGYAAKCSPSIRTFTVGFGDQPDFDEIGIAAETAKRFGLPHTPIRIPGQDAEATAAEWFAMADQPSMDGLNTFVISKAIRSEGIKVALCGLGADELFGGYPSFRDVPKLQSLSRKVGWLPSSARRAVAGVLTATKPAVVRQKLFDMLSGASTAGRLALHRRRVMSDRQFSEFGLSAGDCGLTSDWLPPEAEAWIPDERADLGWAVSVVESRFYQTNVLLRDSDANGMAHALEIRVPFLDQRLLNFAHRLPGAVRFPPDKPPKALLREAAAEILHEDLLKRPKTGFTLPLRRWMTGPLRSTCELGLKSLKETGLVQPGGVDTVWNAFLADPESQVWSRALALVVLGDYLRRHLAIP